MQGDHVPDDPFDSLCAAVATETGIPVGRVKKVLLSARHHQQSGKPPAPPEPWPGQDDPLRYYPLGANGRIHPPVPQPRADDAKPPA
jgi:hypothetical protein